MFKAVYSKPLPVIKESGPYITARHSRFTFGSISLGKTQNLCGATSPEGPSNQGSPSNQGGVSILDGGLFHFEKNESVLAI